MTEVISNAVVRFAGDSGDGMQLTGDRFTSSAAFAGNDLATLPDYPAEIRAPAGTLAGVSSFQLHFSDHDIHTPGDRPDVLVAMNPAALKKHLPDLRGAGTLIVNTDAFTKRNLQKAEYEDDPLEDGSLEDLKVIRIAITDLTMRAVEDLLEAGDINKKEAERAKNMFALGLVLWMYSRETATTEGWLEQKFGKLPHIKEANVRALRAGHAYGETTEVIAQPFEVPAAKLAAGTYRNVTGNQATALGLIAAAQKAGLPLFYGSYPITPASDILHELAKHKNFDVRTFQAEDEIAAMGSVLGAAFGGVLACTASSGPGIALKGEAMGLGMMVELPMVIVNVQRGGPSTGLPTKAEQSDLLQVMYARNGESPLPVIAAQSPSDCFYAAYEAARIALLHRMPVILLTDGYLANSAEPWLIPDVDDLPPIDVEFTTEPNTPEGFAPYLHDPETLARPWAVPGTPGLQHRLGGLEKWDVSGHISYDGENHHAMTQLRHDKVAAVAKSLPPLEVDHDEGADLLVLGWGSTYGPIRAAVNRLRKEHGRAVARAHLRSLAPFPDDLGDVLSRYRKVLVPENNMGQLAMLVRARYLVDATPYNRVTGLPFRSDELVDKMLEQLNDVALEGLI